VKCSLRCEACLLVIHARGDLMLFTRVNIIFESTHLAGVSVEMQDGVVLLLRAHRDGRENTEPVSWKMEYNELSC
jgi:hypothetical protein